jgi:glycine/D-amino acid oxidase-like deaminating enzyme
MDKKYDVVIVGAGIAGMLIALRLTLAGKKVAVIDRDKIGSGMTISNHGMVHSGALYVKHHPHIVKNCQQAQAAFSTLFGDAEVPTEDALYIASNENIADMAKLLNNFDIKNKPVDLSATPEATQELIESHQALAIEQRVFSSRRILHDLAGMCLARGVEFLLGSKITRLLHHDHNVLGVEVGAGQHVLGSQVVLAPGLGLSALLQSFNSHYRQFMKSRLDIMVHLPHAGIRRGLIFAELDRPILMPAMDGSALGSYFGGIQPQIHGDRKFAVDFTRSQILLEMTQKYFNPDVVNTSDATFYMCGKTDYIGNATAEKGFIDPGFHIVDHHQHDRIYGLYSVVTGKMTLAFHASKAVADDILGTKNDLVIAKQKVAAVPHAMLTVEPWAQPDKL